MLITSDTAALAPPRSWPGAQTRGQVPALKELEDNSGLSTGFPPTVVWAQTPVTLHSP